MGQGVGDATSRLFRFAENMPKSAFSQRTTRPCQSPIGYIFLALDSFVLRANPCFPKSVSVNNHLVGFSMPKGFPVR